MIRRARETSSPPVARSAGCGSNTAPRAYAGGRPLEIPDTSDTPSHTRLGAFPPWPRNPSPASIPRARRFSSASTSTSRRMTPGRSPTTGGSAWPSPRSSRSSTAAAGRFLCRTSAGPPARASRRSFHSPPSPSGLANSWASPWRLPVIPVAPTRMPRPRRCRPAACSCSRTCGLTRGRRRGTTSSTSTASPVWPMPTSTTPSAPATAPRRACTRCLWR